MDDIKLEGPEYKGPRATMQPTAEVAPILDEAQYIMFEPDHEAEKACGKPKLFIQKDAQSTLWEGARDYYWTDEPKYYTAAAVQTIMNERDAERVQAIELRAQLQRANTDFLIWLPIVFAIGVGLGGMLASVI